MARFAAHGRKSPRSAAAALLAVAGTLVVAQLLGSGGSGRLLPLSGVAVAAALWTGVVWLLAKSGVALEQLLDGHADGTGQIDLAAATAAAEAAAGASDERRLSGSGADPAVFSPTGGSGAPWRPAGQFAVAAGCVAAAATAAEQLGAALGVAGVQSGAVLAGYGAMGAAALAPWSPELRYAQDRVRASLRRSFAVAPSQLAGPHAVAVQFIDVLLCDVLTSFSGLLGIAGVAVLDAVGLQPAVARMGGPLWPLALLMLPYLVRLKQCLSEAAQASEGDSPLDRRTRVRRRHLANALKYATALPVLVLQTATGAETPGRAWLVAAAVNAGYSLYWDVRVDWLLGRVGGPGPVLLRERLWFTGQARWYYAAIAADTALRFSFLVRVVPGLGASTEVLLRVAELGRRMGWCVFRLEREWIMSPGSGGRRVFGLG